MAALLGEIPLGRMGQPDEIAGLALYLASDPAAYVTGCVLYSGGLGVFPKHPMAQEGCYAQIIIACVHLVGEVPAL